MELTSTPQTHKKYIYIRAIFTENKLELGRKTLIQPKL